MSRLKILVVEDNPADVSLLRYALDTQREEYDLEVLTDGEEALRFVFEHRTRKREPEPCVIVMDLHLPRHDGLSVLRAVVETPGLTHIRVIVLAGGATADELRQVVELGAFYRPKAASLQELVELAEEIIALCKETMPRVTV